MFVRRQILIGLILSIAALLGCDAQNGTLTSEITLPTDTELTLSCENMAVHPETCVLDDPDNPFRNVVITENVYGEDADGNRITITETNKFELADNCPSAKSLVYLWATALARSAQGENQYYAAQALHQLYTEGGSANAREQAKKAYRSVLDHFFGSTTWYNAWWIDAETVYAVMLKDLVGQSLYDPADMNLTPLYDDPVLALADLSEWGYVYNQETGIMTKRN